MHDLIYKVIKPRKALKNQEKDQQMNLKSLMIIKQIIGIMTDLFRTKLRINIKV